MFKAVKKTRKYFPFTLITVRFKGDVWIFTVLLPGCLGRFLFHTDYGICLNIMTVTNEEKFLRSSINSIFLRASKLVFSSF